tara:strand:- start:3961 stop:4158 length:198 start_codon:yes stop_codon:yes gene_type:complete
MKFLQNIFKILPINIDLSPARKPILGRWALNHCDIAYLKADMTNEDHCGVCDKMRNNYLSIQSKK